MENPAKNNEFTAVFVTLTNGQRRIVHTENAHDQFDSNFDLTPDLKCYQIVKLTRPDRGEANSKVCSIVQLHLGLQPPLGYEAGPRFWSVNAKETPAEIIQQFKDAGLALPRVVVQSPPSRLEVGFKKLVKKAASRFHLGS